MAQVLLEAQVLMEGLDHREQQVSLESEDRLEPLEPQVSMEQLVALAQLAHQGRWEPLAELELPDPLVVPVFLDLVDRPVR